MISSIHLHTNRKSPPLDLFKVLIILVVLLTFPKINNSLLPRTSRLSLPIFRKGSIIKILPNIQCYSISGVTMYPFFSLSGWLLMFYLVMVQPPFFPSFQLGTHFSKLHPLYFVQPAWKRSSEKERMKKR